MTPVTSQMRPGKIKKSLDLDKKASKFGVVVSAISPNGSKKSKNRKSMIGSNHIFEQFEEHGNNIMTPNDMEPRSFGDHSNLEGWMNTVT